MLFLYYTLGKFVIIQPWVNLFKFVEDRVLFLECSPVSCLAPRYHCEEKCEKFRTRRINNKLSSQCSFDMQVYFFIWVNKNCFSRRKKSSFERNTILSCLPGTPNSKYMYFDDLLKYNNTFHFARRRPTCMFRQKQRFTWNAGFFGVEICNFSVFAYNFYSFNWHIVVELSFAQRNWKMLPENC